MGKAVARQREKQATRTSAGETKLVKPIINKVDKVSRRGKRVAKKAAGGNGTPMEATSRTCGPSVTAAIPGRHWQQEESLQLAENSSSAALDGARLEGSSSGHAVAGMPTAEGQAAKVEETTARRRRQGATNSPHAAQHQAQLMDYVSTAEDDAAGHDGGDARAERNSPVGVAQAGRRRVKLLKSKPKKSELKNPELKKGRQPCAECLCKDSCAWRGGKANGVFPNQVLCNRCAIWDWRHGIEVDPETYQVTIPEWPRGKGKGKGQGRAMGKGRGKGRKATGEAAGEDLGGRDAAEALLRAAGVVAQQETAVLSDSSADASAAIPRQETDSGGCSGEQQGDGVNAGGALKGAGALEGAGAAEALMLQGEEEQRWVQSAARKDAECQLCAPVTRKRRATLASFDTTADLDSKKQKVYNLQADSRLAAFAAGAVQHCIRSSSGGQMLPEAWGFGSQQSHEHALEAMGASSEEQEAMDILLSLSEETTTPFGEGAVI